jgi:quercetin dioxygenase-like cupin family protein
LRAAVFIVLFAAPAFANDEAMLGRVQALLRAHQADVFGCAEKAAPAGEVLVRVIVGEKGRAAKAEVLKAEAGAGAVNACLVEKVRAWDLSSLGASEGDQIVFPLAFKPDANEPKAKLDVVEVSPTSRIDCGKSPEQALYVLAGPVNVNDTILFTGDLMWLPPNAACTLKPGERALFKVLRVRSQLPAGTSEARQPFAVRKKELETLPIAGGKGSVSLYLDGRGATFSVQALAADAGAKVPPHKHDTSDELIYVISGRGTTTVAGKPVATTPGAQLRVPAGVEHSLAVDEKLTTVQIYAPGGPEQRFKGAAK